MKNKAIITITTDFGDDFALAQLQAVLLSVNPQVQTVVISNRISPFSLVEGAFILSQVNSLFPSGTIHIGVIDPGVGSCREGIVIKTKRHLFIGPNNGLFDQATIGKERELYQIREDLVSNQISSTFHGRDIFAKLAAYLTIGEGLDKFTQPLPEDRLVQFSFQSNQILYIDPYGNVKINNSCQGFNIGDILKIQTPQIVTTIPFVKTFSDVLPGQLLAYRGSHKTLEIAKNLGSANKDLQFKIGDTVKVERVVKHG